MSDDVIGEIKVHISSAGFQVTHKESNFSSSSAQNSREHFTEKLRQSVYEFDLHTIDFDDTNFQAGRLLAGAPSL